MSYPEPWTNASAYRKMKNLEAENTRLKAEVERLTKRLNRHLEINDELDARCTRLRKAGDAMVDYIERTESNAYDIEADGDDRIAEWYAAKEGKGQP